MFLCVEILLQVNETHLAHVKASDGAITGDNVLGGDEVGSWFNTFIRTQFRVFDKKRTDSTAYITGFYSAWATLGADTTYKNQLRLDM